MIEDLWQSLPAAVAIVALVAGLVVGFRVGCRRRQAAEEADWEAIPLTEAQQEHLAAADRIRRRAEDEADRVLNETYNRVQEDFWNEVAQVWPAYRSQRHRLTKTVVRGGRAQILVHRTKHHPE